MRHAAAPDSHRLQPRPVDRLSTALGRYRQGGRRARAIRRTVSILLLAVAGVLAAAGPTPGDGGTAVQAVTRDLPVGATLQAADLRTVAVRSPPDGAVPPEQAAVGRVLAGPVRRGEMLTDARLLGARGPAPGAGRAAVAVRPDDPGLVALLAPGMRIALIGVDRDGATRPLTDDAVVLSIPDADSAGARAHDGRLVVLAVPSAAADAVTAATLTGSIGITFT